MPSNCSLDYIIDAGLAIVAIGLAGLAIAYSLGLGA